MMVSRHYLGAILIAVAMASSTVNADTVDKILELYHSQACQGEYDVVVLLDRSKKVDAGIFAEYIQLIKKLLTLFDIREDGNRFGLVQYNETPKVEMKLNENNNRSFIENYLMTSLPGRSGHRNIRRALRATRQNLLTTAMGDRPDAPNICLVLTTAHDVRTNGQFPKIEPFCKFFFVLREGDKTDFQRVRDRVCRSTTGDEAENRTTNFCNYLSNFCDGLTGSCNGNTDRLCPLPYTEVGEYCIFLTYTRQSFSESLVECDKKNGSLVKIDSEEKNVALAEYFTSLPVGPGNDFLWMGLRDETGDNVDYRWVVDGTNLTYSNWTPSQPGSTSQLCAGFGTFSLQPGLPPGTWIDELCSTSYLAICETEQG